MVVKSEETELVGALEVICLGNDGRADSSELLDRKRVSSEAIPIPTLRDQILDETTPRTEGIPFTNENEMRAVSAVRYDGMNKSESDCNDSSIEVNPITAHECGETEGMRLSNEAEATNTQESAESGYTETRDDPKAKSPSTAFPDSLNVLSGDVNECTDIKNDEETSTMRTESCPSLSTDENTANNSNCALSSTLPSIELDSIQDSLAQRKARLVYMTPQEVLALRDRIVQVETRRGPFLFLPVKRHAPYAPRTSSVDPAMENLLRERYQLRQENSHLKHVLSMFLETQRMRGSNIKRI